MARAKANSTSAGQVPTLTAPVAPGERFAIIDIIRGFALFGVLLANMVWTTQWFALSEEQRDTIPTAGIDDLAGSVVNMFIDYKFYTLFSMLFGLGFAIQLSRATERDRNVLPTYIRRLIILFLIGAVHAILLWFGDVLHTYAILGLVLILFRRCSERTILAWCIGIAALVFIVVPLLQWLSDGFGMANMTDAEEAARTAGKFAAMTAGNWGDIIALNWDVQLWYYTRSYLGAGGDGTIVWYLNILWKFLLGFYIGRRMLLQNAAQHLDLFRRAFPWLLLVGLVGNAYMTASPFVFDTWIPAERSALVLTWIPVEIAIIALSLAYLCGLVLLHQRPATRRSVGLLAPVGRMALTNYLTHSVLIVVLFYGVGFGLLGKVGVGGCILISIAIFAGQIALSAWWLKHFRFGPMEWVWRCLTYGRMQPFRIGEA